MEKKWTALVARRAIERAIKMCSRAA